MKLGIGIDTGGTFTDAVLYDLESNSILASAKSLTIRENLVLGINSVLDIVPPEKLQEVDLVSLSTTLATNACVEGKESKAVLVLIGCYEDIAQKYGSNYGLPDTKEIIFIGGRHSYEGKVETEPDWERLKEKVLPFKDRINAFAVVERWGMRNPEFEKKAKDIIINLLGVKVVCGYELTSELNFLKRAASALLNAKLLPIINEFLDAVKTSMKIKGITAPLVIVRGDGSLMSEEFASDNPIETLLCGPAASIVGSIYLTDEKNCMVVDMGGTTTDLAIVRNGRATLTDEGAQVGKWRTGTKSIYINTVGLGGDSTIRHTNEGGISIGPIRSAPLSWLASKYPETLVKMREIYSQKRRHTHSLCEFLYLVKEVPAQGLKGVDLEIYKALQDGPLSIEEVCKKAGISIYELKTKDLEGQGLVMRSSLTPTDIMHVTGDFSNWNHEAALLGASIIAFQLGISVEELTAKVYHRVKEGLYSKILNFLIEAEDASLVKGGISKQISDIIHRSFLNSLHTCQDDQVFNFRCNFHTGYSLVGIGAPTHIFLPDVARALNTNYIIPNHAPVANAVGAITGNVSVEEAVRIRPSYEITGINGFVCFARDERREFALLSEAVEWAKSKAEVLALEESKKRGSKSPNIIVEVNDSFGTISNAYATEDSRGALYLETVVLARAVGKLSIV
jgi:N-methylhydantoinase A/oxoprolinase/acetone carboxylase beta subunit